MQRTISATANSAAPVQNPEPNPRNPDLSIGSGEYFLSHVLRAHDEIKQRDTDQERQRNENGSASFRVEERRAEHSETHQNTAGRNKSRDFKSAFRLIGTALQN